MLGQKALGIQFSTVYPVPKASLWLDKCYAYISMGIILLSQFG